MGWRLLRLLGSVLGFFSIGVIAAVVRGEGTVPVVRDEWMRVIGGARESDGGFKQGSWEGVELTG